MKTVCLLLVWAGMQAGSAAEGKPFVNSFGMKFVPVEGAKVLFCIWETRVKDFEAFVKDSGYRWNEKPPFEQTPEHPVVLVSWYDANAFCAWLSKKEGREYRLPTDAEWDAAVGLGKYPWGSEWPPPQRVENIAGEESQIGSADDPKEFLTGYKDDHPRIAPVGSYRMNKAGLYDVGGNVREWVQDWYTEVLYARHKESGGLGLSGSAVKDIMKGNVRRVTRGGRWDFERKTALISQNRRDPSLPEERDESLGFRVVCGISSGAMKVPQPVRAPSSPGGVLGAAVPEKPKDVPPEAEYFDGRWFHIYHEDLSWEEAQKRCRLLGGRLAIVPDKATWLFLSRKVGKDHLWLGARDERKEGKWKWIDGSRMNFTAWGPGQPNTDRAKQDYVYARNNGWYDIGGNGHFNGKLQVHGFICEWHAGD